MITLSATRINYIEKRFRAVYRYESLTNYKMHQNAQYNVARKLLCSVKYWILAIDKTVITSKATMIYVSGMFRWRAKMYTM